MTVAGQRGYNELVPLSKKRIGAHGFDPVCHKCGVALFEGDMVLPHRAGNKGHKIRIYCEACKDLWL